MTVLLPLTKVVNRSKPFMPKKLKILYDPQMFDLQNYGGISRYFSNLITAFNKRTDMEVKLPLVYSGNYYVRNFSQLLHKAIGGRLLKNVSRRSKANLYFSKKTIIKGDFDVLHASYYNPYFLDDLKKPLVITVHDMIHENYPTLHQDIDEIIHQKEVMINAADAIIAISEYTRQQILKYYPQHAHKIHVIYHGIPEHFNQASNIELPKKFMLYVGDRTAGYKNFRPMITAIAALLRADASLTMRCAGGGAFNTEEIDLFAALGIQAQILQVDASDSLMKQLYKEALLLIYPSIEEGFGLPMLEAFSNGCPIACSGRSSLPEVGGQAAVYFDPENIQSMYAIVQDLASNNSLRQNHINLGYEQLKKFTFENCINQTVECYKSVLKSPYLK